MSEFNRLNLFNGTDTEAEITAMVKKVNEFDSHFPDLENVAAICVHPANTWL